MSEKTNNFISKATDIHGCRYDYSKVEYIGSRKKVIIICKIHGEFEQKCYVHLAGHGCKLCGEIFLKNSVQFIEEATQLHGDTYDYSKVEYKNAKTKVIIICKQHGDFLQTPDIHLRGSGCKFCAIKVNSNNRTTTKDFFINKVIEVHGNKYDYSKVEYKNTNTKVTIICKIHGEFLQLPSSHFKYGCKLCAAEKKASLRRSSKEEFISKAISIHGNKYDYSKSNYYNSNTKIIIKCKIHGEFEQNPAAHLNGSGCILCGYQMISKKKSSNKETFISKAIEIHGDKYDYSNMVYINCKKKVSILCRIHGEFFQTPDNHLGGKGCNKCGCNVYSKMQIKWLDFLSKYYCIKIQHAENGGEVFILNTRLRADGYCEQNNTIYEFHGSFWHGDPSIYDPHAINIITKCSFGELYKRTKEKEQKIINYGFNLVTIWESDWIKINKSIKAFQMKYRKIRKSRVNF